MRYIHFYGDAGYCGTDYHIFDTYPDDTSDTQIENDSDDHRRNNASGFEYLETGWDGEFEDEEAYEAYYENATGYWDELSEKEYEQLKEDYGEG